MLVNADFDQRVLVDTNSTEWIPSPQAGVDRRMLDRVGEEVARATSLVRYVAGSAFPEHTHGGGEEFLVLEGVFSDASGDFGPGHYVRNAVGSCHAPWSHDGAVILVKLRQMQPHEPSMRAHTPSLLKDLAEQHPEAPVLRAVLYECAETGERVTMEQWRAGGEERGDAVGHEDGEEVFVVEGSLEEENAAGETLVLEKGFWLRHPPSPGEKRAVLRRSAPGCVVWRKTGHLRNVKIM